MSRRGVATLSLELFVALLVAATVLVIMLVYVQSSLEASGYFRDFYAKDLSMLSDVITAAPGDISVTYNNLKQGMGLVFSFREGEVEVSIDEEFPATGIYSTYDGLITPVVSFRDPQFLSFMKSKDRFRVSEATGVVRSCERVEQTTTPKPFVTSANETEQQLLLQGLRGPLSLANIGVYAQGGEQAPNMIFRVTYEEGSRVVRIRHLDSPEMTFFSCLLENNLATLGLEVSMERVSQLERSDAHITLGREDLPAHLLGQLIGQAVVVYAR